MRVLIGGILGAAASAAAWLGLESVLEKEFGWAAILVGLVTGMAVHAAAGKPTGVGYLRGALAAVLALAGIVGGQMVKAEIMKASNAAQKVAEVPEVKPAEGQADEDEAADTEGEVAEPMEPMADMTGLGDRDPTRFGKQNLKKSLSQWDMVYLCGAALVAYMIGKGSDGPKAVSEEQASETPQDEGSEGEESA
ncbi:MAG: hypothetical protein MI725_06395 [Pirellulales bacterium]|nr:hypothetical protein [Pirellulales bacterium]